MTSRPRQSRRRWTGREGHQLTNSVGRNSTEKTKGVVPRQTSSLWNIGPTGRCFKTNPQHTRPLSGANLSSGVRIAFRRRTTTGRSSSPSQTGPNLKGGRGKGGRSFRSWYLCVQNKPAKEEAPNVEPRRGGGSRTCASLIDAATAKAVRN